MFIVCVVIDFVYAKVVYFADFTNKKGAASKVFDSPNENYFIKIRYRLR